jgi:hypothetical protein
MRPLRVLLVIATAVFAWRVFSGRARQAIQRLVAMGQLHTIGEAPGMRVGEERGIHTSAAAAANHDFWDDRDIAVGEKLSAVGMKPGAR